MRRPDWRSLIPFFYIVAVSISILEVRAQTLMKQNPPNNPRSSSTSAILVFGDSTVDSGNNNFIGTIFKSNFPPYGRDFCNHIPTGRFTNGRLVTDYIVSYVGIKEYVPPYLDSKLSIKELMTGVSFASAGSGFDPLTAQITDYVIPMSKQLEYFKEYKTKLEMAIGKERSRDVIKKAAFIISAGTNDFIVNYFLTPIRRQSYTVSSYQQFLIQQLHQFIQDLGEEGAQRIAIVGLPPMGCLPAVITLYSNDSFHGRRCIESLSKVARDHNQMLQNKLKSMQNNGLKLVYIDIYTPLINIIRGHKFGFDEVSAGCCGTGFLEASFLCNPKSPVCADASKYVFWDSIHPTEKAYYIIFQSLRSTIDFFLKL